MSAEVYIEELKREIDVLNPREFQHAVRLLEAEIHNVGANNDERYERSAPDKKYDEEIVILTEKIILPIEDYPRFNFVGRLLGPKGSTMKSLQESTKTKISILGKGSTRDREKEEELSQSDDPKNEHFKEPLHIVISAKARRSDAHERLADCMEEINKCMDFENESRPMERHDDRPHHRPGLPINGFDMRRHDNRGLGLPTPIIKVGIPPPGAIILNGPPVGANGNPRTGGRGGGRGRGDRRSRPY